ncbi:MAG TPA: hypothetical protein VJQ51_10180 [Burkholderiales bacterium]|nr:hypothetical protein [Burkholderiales bacterium]
MSRSIMIMAVATGLIDFGSGITRASRALACAEDVTTIAVEEGGR